MKRTYPAIYSSLSKEEEDTLRKLSAFYKVLSQYTQTHLNLLGLPLLFNDYEKLWKHDLFKEWLTQFGNSINFGTIRPNPEDLNYLKMFDMPDLSLCLDGWSEDEELSSLVAKFELTQSLIEQAENITYKVMNQVLREHYGDDVPQMPEALFNADVFILAIAIPQKDENYRFVEDENIVGQLKNFCNTTHQAVEYAKRFPHKKDTLVGNDVLMNRAYRYVLSEVYGSLENNCKALFAQNENLAKKSWYETALNNDYLKDDKGNPLLRTYKVQERKNDNCFVNFQKIHEDFKASQTNDTLNGIFNLMAEFSL